MRNHNDRFLHPQNFTNFLPSVFISSRRIGNVTHSQYSLQSHTYTNSDSFVSALIAAVSSSSSISHCQTLHCRVIKFVSYRHGFIGDQLVSAYVRLGSLADALNLFDELPQWDLLSWNSLISGISRTWNLACCMELFSRMRLEMGMEINEITLIPVISACADIGAFDLGKCIHGFAIKLGLLLEVKVANSLINFYGKSRDLKTACGLFETMPVQSSITWNSLIAVHVYVGLAEEGMRYFINMKRAGFMTGQDSLVSVLQACQILGLRRLAEAVHGYVFSCGLNLNLTIATTFLNLYAKLGVLTASQKVFNEMTNPDAVAWTTMLAGYAVHGCGRESLHHFELMIKNCVLPDHVTFTHLLSACSHSGLVEEGKRYFGIMSEVYGVEPRVDHYSCMVDLLGRSGRLNDAYELIRTMPVEPNSGVWGALIGACRVYGNIELGREVAAQLFSLDPSDSRNYIILSNMYSAVGQWREASKMRALMKERNVVRNPGCSFIEHGNKIHCFVAGDQSHPETENIYKRLEVILGKIREAGFEPKTELVLHDVDEEVKEDLINKHSEKLAIAFGLLVTDAGMPLIITKNLRICGDCHNIAKLVSKIEMRTIIIQDMKRFHHFSNGVCSCGDYW